MRLRFYGKDERAMRSGLHGAAEELTANVRLSGRIDALTDDDFDAILTAIARKLTHKRAAYIEPSFGIDARRKAVIAALARKTGHVALPTSHGRVYFQILSAR